MVPPFGWTRSRSTADVAARHGGATDTANLIALCSRHHRLHHLGQLGIAGNGDEPDGMVFTDSQGRRLTGAGRPAPPDEVAITGTWAHPSGERLHPRWVHFNEALVPPPDHTPVTVSCAFGGAGWLAMDATSS